MDQKNSYKNFNHYCMRYLMLEFLKEVFHRVHVRWVGLPNPLLPVAGSALGVGAGTIISEVSDDSKGHWFILCSNCKDCCISTEQADSLWVAALAVV
jgi:hypothetical protein